jgi:lipoyl(octanoyl) transferase
MRASGLVIERWGLPDTAIDYGVARERQALVHDSVVDGTAPDTVLLLQHRPVFTAGRRTEAHERPFDAPVVGVDRGGKITWHGPGQIVGYPILRLRDAIGVVDYVRALERTLIAICADLGVTARAVPGRTGVWIDDRKVAAIGVRVSRRVTLHGFALNVDCPLEEYARIVPCGISDASVTRLTDEIPGGISIADALPMVERHLPTLHEAVGWNG